MGEVLRSFNRQGCHFRREVPIGPYIVDFVWLQRKLIIEVDGGQHGFDEQVAYDRRRTKWLEGNGFQVLRFWNGDILDSPDAVADRLHRQCFPAEHTACTTVMENRL